jgi:hypothetical protein
MEPEFYYNTLQTFLGTQVEIIRQRVRNVWFKHDAPNMTRQTLLLFGGH